MATSDLALDYDGLRSRVGYYLGYGRDSSDWTSAQQADIAAAIEDGYRMFLNPQLVPGQRMAHEWRFLKPASEITLPAALAVDSTRTVTGGSFSGGVTDVTADSSVFYPTHVGDRVTITGVGTFTIASYTSATVVNVTGDARSASGATYSIAVDGNYPLPDDFAALDGELTHVATNGYHSVERRGEAYVRELRQQTTAAGIPRFAGVRPMAKAATAQQLFELVVWPTPDTTYVFKYRYSVLQNKLNQTTNKYPLGGAAHSQTVLEACLAAAELHVLEDRAGPKMQSFVARMTASIAADQRNEENMLGYCGDDSDARFGAGPNHARRRRLGGANYTLSVNGSEL